MPGIRRMRVGRQSTGSQDWSASRVRDSPPGRLWLADTSTAWDRPRHQFAVSLRTAVCRTRIVDVEPEFAPPATSVDDVVESMAMPEAGSIAAIVRTVWVSSRPAIAPPAS